MLTIIWSHLFFRRFSIRLFYGICRYINTKRGMKDIRFEGDWQEANHFLHVLKTSWSPSPIPFCLIQNCCKEFLKPVITHFIEVLSPDSHHLVLFQFFVRLCKIRSSFIWTVAISFLLSSFFRRCSLRLPFCAFQTLQRTAYLKSAAAW